MRVTAAMPVFIVAAPSAPDPGMAAKRYTIDLPRHMAECDANYLRLRKLFPRLEEHEGAAFALGQSDGPVVRLDVLERAPYTTLVRVSQVRQGAEGEDPSIKVRMYHDARSAEVIEFQNERRFAAVYDYPNEKMRHKDEKVQINRFLGEFLAHCLEHGVSLSRDWGEPATAQR